MNDFSNNTPKLYVPPGGPPNRSVPSEIYYHMKEDGIFAMLAEFYERLGHSPISHLFPDNAQARLDASKRSAAFFVQICGGPPLYNNTYGAPKMRARHLPFPIDESAKEEWLKCFFSVLETAPERYNFPLDHMPSFKAWLTGFAGWMVNRHSPSAMD